jgi:hypothetical protein
MRKRIAATVAALVFMVVMAGTAMAGNTGYEGQPGNQSSGGGGNAGYEGQPGNQSNN